MATHSNLRRNPRLPDVPEVIDVPVQTSRFPIPISPRFAAEPVQELTLPPVPDMPGLPEEPKVATVFDLAAYARQLATEAGDEQATEYVLQTISLCDRPDVIAEAWAREALKDALRCRAVKEKLEIILMLTDPKERPRAFEQTMKMTIRARAEERKARQWFLSLMSQSRKFQMEDLKFGAWAGRRDNPTKLRRVNELTMRLRERAGRDPAEAETG